MKVEGIEESTVERPHPPVISRLACSPDYSFTTRLLHFIPTPQTIFHGNAAGEEDRIFNAVQGDVNRRGRR